MNTTRFSLHEADAAGRIPASFLRLLILIGLLIAGIGVRAQDSVTLVLAAYAVPREAYAAIIPLFQAQWLAETGQIVEFQESYQASGAQSRAVAGGFAADLVSLSIEPDVTRLVDAGLISADWNQNATRGVVTQSVVVLVTREGNPRSITGWADLLQEGVQVITPDPATSGGAQWNLLAVIGAVQRGTVAGYEGAAGIEAYLTALIPNIAVLDKDGRESFLTFERGVGDVAITYENEIVTAQQVGTGAAYTVVYPESTILIENPIAVVDTYVDQRGTREAAEAFVEFVVSPEAQRIFAEKGYRPVNDVVRAEVGLPPAEAAAPEIEATAESAVTAEAVATVEAADAAATTEAAVEGPFPAITDLFTIAEFGGWPAARRTYFGDEGLFTRLIATGQ